MVATSRGGGRDGPVSMRCSVNFYRSCLKHAASRTLLKGAPTISRFSIVHTHNFLLFNSQVAPSASNLFDLVPAPGLIFDTFHSSSLRPCGPVRDRSSSTRSHPRPTKGSTGTTPPPLCAQASRKDNAGTRDREPIQELHKGRRQARPLSQTTTCGNDKTILPTLYSQSRAMRLAVLLDNTGALLTSNTLNAAGSDTEEEVAIALAIITNATGPSAPSLIYNLRAGTLVK